VAAFVVGLGRLNSVLPPRPAPLSRLSPILSIAAALALIAPSPAAPQGGEKLHFTYHWHMEQPVYWPDVQTSGFNRYERAWESILRTDAGAAHPANDLRQIFGKADRVAAYQYRVRDSIGLFSWAEEAGAQVSYSGGLIENMQSLGDAWQLGYTPDWADPYQEARSWTTVGTGVPRCDILAFPFHHALMPLLPESAMRKELELYLAIYDDAWSTQPGMSKGFFPTELAFSERMIPVLAELGVEWSFVSGEKISRACSDFPVILGSGGINCDPPNLADQINPAQVDYFRQSISRGCSPAEAYPFAFTPHRAGWVDPQTGAISSIVVVPSSQSLSWKDGAAPLSPSYLDALQAKNDPNRPMLLALAHDGDNAWGGGYDYYINAVPNFVAQAEAAGYRASVVQEYLTDHPVPANDFIHVEDGAWVNADGDFGSPQFLNWNWPPVNQSGAIDVENGWAEDIRNWAVIIAALNHVETAEQIFSSGGGSVDIDGILYPSPSSNAVESAWHYFLGALNSGYMYYGTALDMEVKPTIAVNQALQFTAGVIGNGALDQTPPTLWLSQRQPWNPGSLNYGPAYGYREFYDDGDFHIWTFAYDLSGISKLTLKYRVDADGQNPLLSTQNETYQGGTEVGTWTDLPMTRRNFPAGNFFNDPGIDFFVMPQNIAEQWYVEVIGLRDTLIDYYIEATDAKGNLVKGDIQHVWIGDGSGSGGTVGSVEIVPDPPIAGQTLTVRYDPGTSGVLTGATQVFLHAGMNGWNPVAPNDFSMSWNSLDSIWEYSANVPANATQVDFAFNDGNGIWDNNNGSDWHYSTQGGGGGGNWTMDGQLDPAAVLVSSNNGVNLWAGLKGNELYVATEPAGNGYDRFLLLARQPGAPTQAMWAKAGTVAAWDAYIGAEADNGFHSWFDTQSTANAASGAILEGVIDLQQEFGSLPPQIYLSVALYPTANGSLLDSARQVPGSLNGDGNVDPGEFKKLP
jgi:glycosyl hydrolase family 57